MTSQHDWTEIAAIADALADAARVETLRYFRQPGLTAETKETTRFDPVTVADRASEAAMRAILGQRRPQDGILGEEFGSVEGTSGLTWVLDPIDGTRGYLSGTPTWGVLIAVNQGGRPILGVIDQPYIGERFTGAPGGAMMTGPQGAAHLRCRAARPIGESIVFSTFPEVGTPIEGAAFARVAARARLVRYGMDCYAYALLAAGQIDLVIEAGLQAYDVQAPMAVIEAAGGIVTAWDGSDCTLGGRVLAAANPEVHAEAIALLAG